MTDVNLAGAAAMVRRSYSWFQKHWRTLRHPATGEPFPQPYVGAEKGSSPWWKAALIEAWQLGAAAPAAGETRGDTTQRRAANDAAPQPKSTDVSALLAAAGG